MPASTPVRPVRCDVRIAADPDEAFARFTDEIGRWWPMEGHSVHGAEAAVAFTTGLLVETGPDGEPDVWGEVLDWQPPDRLLLTWHPGRPDGPATEVEVRFTAAADGTAVALEHRGFGALADAGATRTAYEGGWPAVLDAYAREPDEAWVALLHTPGPGVRAADVATSADFAEHIAFLRRMHDRGWLVAAGPFGDLPGCGMTVLRVPGGEGLAGVEQLATTDDLSVARGLLAVEVRHWQVVLAAEPV
jgi:uncharacterized protein YndB with AHSA1/START domain/uncharacterized protein YciI